MKNNNGHQAFTFQRIPLQEAINLSRIGRGVYAELKEMLSTELPKLEGKQEGFSFGKSKGQMMETKDIRSILYTLNSFLVKSELEWKVNYNGSHKLFICVPKYGIARKRQTPPNEKKQAGEEKLRHLVSRAAQIFKMDKSYIMAAKGHSMTAVKKAVIVFAYRNMHIIGHAIDKFFGYKKGAASWHTYHGQESYQEELKILANAMGESKS